MEEFSYPIQPDSSKHILIRGDNHFVITTIQALELLKEKSPRHFALVTKHIGIIEPIDIQTRIHIMENPPRCQVANSTLNAGLVRYAGALAHEAHHAKLYHDGILLPEQEEEALCEQVQIEAINAVCQFSFEELVDDHKELILFRCCMTKSGFRADKKCGKRRLQ